MNVTELMAKLSALWPNAFNSPEKFQAWTETYQAQLGHLGASALAEAWRRTMAGYDGMRPPMPALILANVPDGKAPLLSGVPGVKSMKGMAEALPEIIGELLTDFWTNLGAWVSEELDRREVPEERRPAVLWAYRDALRRVAHYQAQRIYWQGGDRKLDLDVLGGYFRPYLDGAWHWAKKPAEKRAEFKSSRLGDLAASMVQKAIEQPPAVEA